MTSQSDAERLRAIFDEDAERYDRARPGYPAALFDDLAALAGIGPGCRVLEIGCGTGQATADLAATGADVVGVELGAALAAVAARRLASLPNVRIVHADFDQWRAPAESFDAVLAFTSWHWLDPAVRTGKAAAALRPGGHLVTVETHHVAGAPPGSSKRHSGATSGGTRTRLRVAAAARQATPCPARRTRWRAAGCSRRRSTTGTSAMLPTPPPSTSTC